MAKKEKEEEIKTSGSVHKVVINFVRILLVLAFIGAWRNHRWLVLFIAGLAFFVTYLPNILEKKWGIKIPADFEIMVILFIYGTLFFGEVRGFYAQFWWWDVLLNLAASIALGFVGLTILYVLYKDDKIDASPQVIAFFAFCFAFAMGSLWEIFEFSLDFLFNFHFQNGNLTDTMTDLMTNAVGALIVSISGYYYMKSNKKNLFSRFITKFMERNPKIFKNSKSNQQDKIKQLIKRGEGRRLEFKSTLRTNLHTNDMDKKIEHASMKTIVAYLNSSGGTLLVGVSDRGGITGIEKDNFKSIDKFTLHFTNLLKHHIGPSISSLVEFEIVKIGKHNIMKVDCRESTSPIFLKMDGEEEFYVRNGPSSVKLTGSSLIDYISKRFSGSFTTN